MLLNVLVADDDKNLCKLICDILKKKGYNPVPAFNGKQAMDLFFSSVDFSLCIIDVMMPIYDGWQVLEEIRSKSNVPVLMLTALEDEFYEVKGLRKGADDYIVKPFSYPVFTARIERLIKRELNQKVSQTEYGNLIIDRNAHRVMVYGNEIKLNNKEFKLLCYLSLNKGIVLSRDMILSNIWGFDFDGDIRIVDAHIKMLRNKIGKCAEYIVTVRGSGYKFEVTK